MTTRRLGDFELLREIGRGGMGVVYEADGSHYYAIDLIDGQSLAAVVLDLRGRGSNPLLDAAVTQTAAEPSVRVGHGPPAEPTISLGGGTSLSDSSSGSRKWFDTVARLVADVADALDYAHGRVCVTDFGLAQVAQEPGITVSGCSSRRTARG